VVRRTNDEKLSERLIVRVEMPGIVHHSRYTTGHVNQHDETLCIAETIATGNWRFAAAGSSVNCVFCFGAGVT
jgi:hypothetical protein